MFSWLISIPLPSISCSITTEQSLVKWRDILKSIFSSERQTLKYWLLVSFCLAYHNFSVSKTCELLALFSFSLFFNVRVAAAIFCTMFQSCVTAGLVSTIIRFNNICSTTRNSAITRLQHYPLTGNKWKLFIALLCQNEKLFTMSLHHCFYRLILWALYGTFLRSYITHNHTQRYITTYCQTAYYKYFFNMKTFWWMISEHSA